MSLKEKLEALREKDPAIVFGLEVYRDEKEGFKIVVRGDGDKIEDFTVDELTVRL